VYTTKGLIKQGQFALENAVKIVDYFSKVFDIEYMLPKCDLLAVHEFSHGAMENWGLITYVSRHNIAELIIRELQHYCSTNN